MANTFAPSIRVYHSLLYDSKMDRILLFGGQAYYHWGMDLQDIWSFDFTSSRWEYLGELEAGEVYSLAYDVDHQRAIMLNLKGETWTYETGSRTWEKRNPPEAPQARYGHRMIYEAHTGLVVLFGGFKSQSITEPPLNETWVYNYASDNWTLMDPKSSPPSRSYHSMVYHPIAERTLIWGGRPYSMRSDLTIWIFDSRLNTWEPLPHSSGPKSRYTYSPMVYCQRSHRIIMFGGLDLTGQFEGRLVDETWLYDLGANEWIKAEGADSPHARSQHAMVFSSVAGKAIVMGGETGGAYAGEFTNDLWLYNSLENRWEQVHLPNH